MPCLKAAARCTRSQLGPQGNGSCWAGNDVGKVDEITAIELLLPRLQLTGP